MPFHLLNILSVILITTTFLASSRKPYWWIRIVDGMIFQITVIIIITIFLFLFTVSFEEIYQFVILILLIACLIYNAKKILPFTPIFTPEVKTTTKYNFKIRLLSCNVRKKNKAYNRLLSLIKKENPSVILLTETDHNWLDAIQEITQDYPYQCLQAQENTYGMALYSKFPLLKTAVKFLVEENIPSIHTNIKISEKQQIQFIGLHPRPPAPWTKEDNKDLELIYAAGTTNWNQLPSIVSGDLNDVGWSPITRQFKIISGLKDPRIGRGLFATYNAFIPFFRVPIDHFFVSNHFNLLTIRKLPKIGSDHFPVIVELGWN